MSRKECSDLYDILGPLEFTLHQTLVKIQPQGYLYSNHYQSDCFIGVQAIADNLNQYRLGTIFLRNFYVGLDYNYDQIVIGLKEGTTYASITLDSSLSETS
jgi:hypothetical protein